MSLKCNVTEVTILLKLSKWHYGEKKAAPLVAELSVKTAKELRDKLADALKGG